MKKTARTRVPGKYTIDSDYQGMVCMYVYLFLGVWFLLNF
jgi:hypothetical protein